jgi:hypothetical protein
VIAPVGRVAGGRDAGPIKTATLTRCVLDPDGDHIEAVFRGD